MTRRYGRKGFSTKKAVRQLLTPYERSGDGRSTVAIEALPAEQATRLLELLPEPQHGDRARDDAPTFAELVRLSTDIDGAVLTGFRVEPDSDQERIILTRLTIPNQVLHHKAVTTLAKGVAHPTVIAVGPDGSVYADWS